MREPEPVRSRDRSDEADGVNQGLTVLSYLIAGVLVWGGAGWLADQALETGFLAPLGIVGGAAAAVYLVIKRFGQLGASADVPPHQTQDRKEAPWG